MKSKIIKVKCPAKINLTLKVGKVRPDGFHPIESIMQTINLYDYLTITLTGGHSNIVLNGNSSEIPYDETNIIYKAAKLFYETTQIKQGVEIYLEKNIPICAGLAGGSTDAAGMLFGLNKLNSDIFSLDKILLLCAKLGSDLNFCYLGGTKLARGRGEILENLQFKSFELSLIKPKNLKISAKEAYQKFDETKAESNLPNDLEFALLPCHEELQKLHALGFQMSGSGPTFFIKKAKIIEKPQGNFEILEGLKTVDHGVLELVN